MKLISRPVALGAALAASLLAASTASCAPKASASPSAKIAALKELRNSGVITPEEYAQRLAQLNGAAPTVPTTAAGPAPAMSGGQQAHLIQDAQLGVAAGQVETPRGWTFQGAATHDPGCDHPGDYISWQTASPDGASGVSMMTGLQYTKSNPQLEAWGRQRGCIIYGSMAAQDFLRDVYVPQKMAGARVVSAQAESDSFPALMQVRQSLQAPLVASAGHVRVSYQQNGRAVEAEVGALTVCRRQNTMNGPLLNCTIPVLTTTWAPAGQLDGFISQSAARIKPSANPEYGQRVAQFDAVSAAQTRAGITSEYNRNTAASRAFANASIDNINRTGAASMAAARRSSDALHQSSSAFARSMGDNADFTAPNGQTFNASNQYSHTYVDQYGHVMQTNSAYPPGPGWTETQGR